MDGFDGLYQLALALGCQARRKADMSRYATFRTGGDAALLIEPCGERALCQLLAFCQIHQIKPFFLGNGSNILVADSGIPGVVFHIGEGFSELSRTGETTIRCGAGVSLARLCRFACDEGLDGLVFAYGIPGSAGGAAFMNAGAYGGELAQAVQGCHHVTPEGKPGFLCGEALGYGYRDSVYRRNGCVITSVDFQLHPGSRQEIRGRMEELMERRKAKQPLEYPSAGSVFKRPEGNFAGALIERCGLKGLRVGGAQVSEKHAGFIVNTGGATSTDVSRLIELIQEKVRGQTGVLLEPEVLRIG